MNLALSMHNALAKLVFSPHNIGACSTCEVKQQEVCTEKTQIFKIRLGEHTLVLPFKQTHNLTVYLWSRKIILQGKNTGILHFAQVHLLWIRKIQLYSWTHKAWKLGHSSAQGTEGKNSCQILSPTPPLSKSKPCVLIVQKQIQKGKKSKRN